jgi:hypothetical protein
VSEDLNEETASLCSKRSEDAERVTYRKHSFSFLEYEIPVANMSKSFPITAVEVYMCVSFEVRFSFIYEK